MTRLDSAKTDATGAVWVVAVSQTLFWASSFYVFHALLPHWESWFGWTRVQVAGGITASLLSAAAAAPLSGMLIDRGHGRTSMLLGGTVASLCLFALSFVTRLGQFYAIWIVLGICHATILYEPCFAILTRRYGLQAKHFITRVTLVAGFAGSVCFPVAWFLTERIGWQKTLWVFSVACLAGTALSNLSLKAINNRAAITTDTQTAREAQRSDSSRPGAKGVTRSIVTSRMFWLTTIAFSLIMLTHGFLLAHLVPLMLERGFTYGAAVLALSLIGPTQVIGRIVMLILQSRMQTDTITRIAFSAIAGACLVLLFADNHLVLVLAIVCVYGSGYGITSIARPAVTAQFFGHVNFGAVSGIMAVPFTTCFALAPALSALVWSFAGYRVVLVGSVGFTLLSVVMLSIASHIAQAQPVSAETEPKP